MPTARVRVTLVLAAEVRSPPWLRLRSIASVVIASVVIASVVINDELHKQFVLERDD